MRVVTDQNETIELGDVETTPTIGITDFSRRVTDDFGVTTVVERGFSRRMSVKLGVQFDAVDTLQRRLAYLRATPALWVADDRFASLSLRGFYKDFALDLATQPLSYCTLTVEGLAETATPADIAGDPAPLGQSSTLQLLQPVTVAGAVLASSNVAENDAAEWSASATYATGARVMRVATHRVYESLTAANVGNDPAGASGKWLDVGPTNRWSMFDEALGTSTNNTSSIQVALNAGSANAVALLDVVASTVRVRATGYDRTVPAGTGAITFLDLPSNAGTVTVTIAGTGTVSVGTLLIGRVTTLGLTEASPTAGITDFSRKDVDEFGEVTIVQRAWAKRMTARALIRTDAVDIVANRIAAVRAQPSLWIGQTGLDSLTVYGFFKDFSIEVGETLSRLSLSIEGLSAAAKLAPIGGGGSVAWPDVTDPTGTKPTDNADVTGDNTSKDTNAIGGRPAPAVLETLDKIVPITLDVSDIKRATVNHDALLRQADRDRAALAAAQIAGLLDQQVTRITLRDAGLITDPDTGRVYIYAVEQNAEKVSKVEIGLDAVTNEIALRATYNDVATMITQAQLSPGDAAEFGELVRRVNVAEISISGMTAAIALKADAITVTQLGGIVQSVSQTLDALSGVVSTKVSYSDFNPVRDRVGTVEQLLQSYGDVSTYQLTLRQAELRGTAAAAAGIASLVSNSDTAQRLIVRSAEIQQQLTVRMDEGDAAEATSRLALAAKVNANEAGLVEERQTRADAVSAQARRTDLLTATVVDQGTTFDARFISQAKAISDGDKAQADRTDILTAAVTKLGQDTAATFAQQAKAISDGDSASATALTQLTARIGDFGLVSVQQAFSVLADRTGKLEGQYTLSIDTNGRLQGFKLAGSASGPASFSFIDTDLNMGIGRVIFNNGLVMMVQGLGFGKNSDLLSWYGPSMQINQCTRTNGLEWKSTDGNLYTSGSIKAGPLSNGGSGTLTAPDASFTLGPFGSNGGPKTIVASYSFRRIRTVSVGGGGAISGAPSATIELQIQGPNSAWARVQTFQTGQPYTDADPATQVDPGRLEESMSGSVTWTDNRTMLEGYLYRLQILSRTQASFSGTASTADSVTQSLSILSQE